MAELSEKEFVRRIKNKAKLLAKDNVPLKVAAQIVHSLRINRIFHAGLNANAGKIGTYNSTKELWASDKQLRRAGTHRGKTGKAIKTSYYKSYKELKAQQGFRNDRVNLRMTNDLQSEFANINISKSNDSPPKGSMPIKINPNRYIERVNNLDKLRGIEAKYGDVFGFTKGEVAKFYKTYNFEAKKILES